MSHKKITHTSTLPGIIIEKVAEYEKKKKISKNKFIEISEKESSEAEIKNELMEYFKKISDDPEIIEMAEWGLEDYVNQLKKLDE